MLLGPHGTQRKRPWVPACTGTTKSEISAPFGSLRAFAAARTRKDRQGAFAPDHTPGRDADASRPLLSTRRLVHDETDLHIDPPLLDAAIPIGDHLDLVDPGPLD